jgi:hypothetical protein
MAKNRARRKEMEFNSTKIRRFSIIGALLVLCLCLNVTVAIASTSATQNAGCWTSDAHCPGEEYLTDCGYYDNGRQFCPFDIYYVNGNVQYDYCFVGSQYYCPSSWTYQIADSVSLDSTSATLSTDYINPLFTSAGVPIDIIAKGTGASAPYQYTLYIRNYDWNNSEWGPWEVLDRGTSNNTYPFNWTPYQLGRYALNVSARAKAKGL